MQVLDLQQFVETNYSESKLLEVPHIDAFFTHFFSALEKGEIRAASPTTSGWQVNEWVKKGILMSFRFYSNDIIEAGQLAFFDKLPPRTDFGHAEGVRIIPPGVVRKGAHVAPGAIVMPGYVNIGAFVGRGSMVDTWATVGSCAQIGENVHLSGGVGIGGVLEPLQASPVIIEEGAFIGSRCIVVEGVRVGKEAVLGANVVLTASTRIIDVTGAHPVEHRGYVPARAVVIPGTMPKAFAAGSYGVPCALIIGERKPSTDLKTSLNATLRDYEIAG